MFAALNPASGRNNSNQLLLMALSDYLFKGQYLKAGQCLLILSNTRSAGSNEYYKLTLGLLNQLNNLLPPNALSKYYTTLLAGQFPYKTDILIHYANHLISLSQTKDDDLELRKEKIEKGYDLLQSYIYIPPYCQDFRAIGLEGILALKLFIINCDIELFDEVDEGLKGWLNWFEKGKLANQFIPSIALRYLDHAYEHLTSISSHSHFHLPLIITLLIKATLAADILDQDKYITSIRTTLTQSGQSNLRNLFLIEKHLFESDNKWYKLGLTIIEKDSNCEFLNIYQIIINKLLSIIELPFKGIFDNINKIKVSDKNQDKIRSLKSLPYLLSALTDRLENDNDLFIQLYCFENLIKGLIIYRNIIQDKGYKQLDGFDQLVKAFNYLFEIRIKWWSNFLFTLPDQLEDEIVQKLSILKISALTILLDLLPSDYNYPILQLIPNLKIIIDENRNELKDWIKELECWN